MENFDHLFIFSEQNTFFLKKIREFSHQILKEEVGLLIQNERFLFINCWAPLSFALFEGKDIGRCIPPLYQISLNIKLMKMGNDLAIKEVIRHELAHLLAFCQFGPEILPHGLEFQEMCLRYFNLKVMKASISWEDLQKVGADLGFDLVEEENSQKNISKLIDKAQKLLLLSKSDNPHEAMLAMQKANRILLQFNSEEFLNESKTSRETSYMMRILEGAQCQEKHRAISSILQQFYVATLFNYGQKRFFLEAVGTKPNVQFAQYLGVYLNRELDRLWSVIKQGQKASLRAKNSFFRGVAEGFKNKMEKDLKSDLNGHEAQKYSVAKIKTEAELEEHLARAYPHLSKSSRRAISDPKWSQIGEETGRNLSFQRPLESSSPEKKYLS